MIELINLRKEFKKPIRGEGVFGMFKTLFSRKYTVKVAVNNINLTINEGEIVGYIGSNGAGKSTSIKMMCGILTPTSGKVLINGIEPYKKRKLVAKDIGVVFGQKTQLWWDIPLIESYKILKEIYQVSDDDYKERMEFLSDILGLNEFMTQPVRTLSLGQRMRADLAASWLHNPSILFLDEPTIGLDVLVKEKIREAIKVMNEKYHTTVILTTHDMKDIENLCSRVVMIEEGNIIYDGTLDNIKKTFGDLRTITINSDKDIDIETCDTFNGLLTFIKEDSNIIIKFNADDISLETVVDYAFKTLHANDMKITAISVEDVVKNILKKQEEKKKHV